MISPPQHRAAQGLVDGLMQMVHGHRNRFFSEASAEGFRVFLNVGDAQMLDEIASRKGDLYVQSTIQDGDTGTLFGMPFTATNNVRPGVSFVGYCVTAPPVTDDGSRW